MKTLFKTAAITIFFAASVLSAFATGEIRGLVTDPTGTPVFATVKVLAGQHVVTGTVCDAEGKYSIKPLQAGKYDVLFIYNSLAPRKVESVIVSDEDVTYLDVELKEYGLDSAVQVSAFKKSLVDPRVTSMKTIGADDIAHSAMPRGDIKAMLTSVSSDVYQDPNDGLLYVRGARKEATQYFIDGERIIGSMQVPATAIENATIITGGIPAQYGDLTGGVVIITTKDYFSGMRAKNMAAREREEKKAQAELAQKKKAEAEKRAKEIEEEKKKLQEEKEKKEKEKQQQEQEDQDGQ